MQGADQLSAGRQQFLLGPLDPLAAEQQQNEQGGKENAGLQQEPASAAHGSETSGGSLSAFCLGNLLQGQSIFVFILPVDF